MAKKLSKAAQDAAFIEKIKSITVGVGAKATVAACPNCHAPLKEHVLKADLLFLPPGQAPPPGAVFIGHIPPRRHILKPKEQEEQTSFSA